MKEQRRLYGEEKVNIDRFQISGTKTEHERNSYSYAC